MNKGHIKLIKDPQKILVRVSGVMDEDIDFSKYSLDGYRTVELDLEELKNMNSCGTREWLNWMRTTQAETINIFNCPKPFIDQVNMIEGFLPEKAKIMSFYVPYLNDRTGSEKKVLLSYGVDYKEGSINLPAKVYDDAGNLLDIDVIESKYFRFIKTMKTQS